MGRGGGVVIFCHFKAKCVVWLLYITHTYNKMIVNICTGGRHWGNCFFKGGGTVALACQFKAKEIGGKTLKCKNMPSKA